MKADIGGYERGYKLVADGRAALAGFRGKD